MMWIVALLASAVTVSVSSPAAARQDPGPPRGTVVGWDSSPFRCPVERIDTQIVRCDNLSGAGVSAPLGIPQRH
ncbi:hypothetical protein ASG91_02640 [Phycicoccus sp. Soil802]|nr:hypothetical protein ASG91_02640 [Phycicoccus sp. Soil802]